MIGARRDILRGDGNPDCFRCDCCSFICEDSISREEQSRSSRDNSRPRGRPGCCSSVPEAGAAECSGDSRNASASRSPRRGFAVDANAAGIAGAGARSNARCAQRRESRPIHRAIGATGNTGFDARRRAPPFSGFRFSRCMDVRAAADRKQIRSSDSFSLVLEWHFDSRALHGGHTAALAGDFYRGIDGRPAGASRNAAGESHALLGRLRAFSGFRDPRNGGVPAGGCGVDDFGR